VSLGPCQSRSRQIRGHFQIKAASKICAVICIMRGARMELRWFVMVNGKAGFRSGGRDAGCAQPSHGVMKTRYVISTIGSLLACVSLAATSTATVPPKITSPASGATPSSGKPLLIKVDTNDQPSVHGVQILSNGSPIGWAVAPDMLGEWSFPTGAHLSVMKPDPHWGPNPPAYIIDYTPDDMSSMMFFQGDFESPTRFRGDTGGHATTPLNVTIDFTLVDGKANIVITGSGSIGTRAHNGGELSRHGRTVFTYQWDQPPVGTHTLTALVTYTDQTTWEKAQHTTDAVTVTVKETAAPEIEVKFAGKNLRDNRSATGFGKVARRAKGKAVTYAIRNVGTGKLKNLKVEIRGAHSKDFVLSQPGKTSIAPGAETTFKVRFAPKKKGTRKAQLRILSNDEDESPFRVALKGTGT
jgi:hypothetical protein